MSTGYLDPGYTGSQDDDEEEEQLTAGDLGIGNIDLGTNRRDPISTETVEQGQETIEERQQDDSGGGVLETVGGAIQGTSDWAVGGIEKETGLRAWRQTETAQELDEDVREGGFLARVDAGAKGLIDFTLDNPRASAQEGVQSGMVGAFNLGRELSGREGDATDEDVAQAWQGAYEGTAEAIEGAVEGTPADNTGTDALSWIGQAVVAEPAKGVFGGLTGVDVETGGTEATTGAADLFDVGVGVATAGTGTALARGGTGLLGRLAGGADEAVAASDEAAQAGDEVLDASTRVFTGSDEAAGATDDAVESAVRGAEDGADEGGSAFRETVIGGSDEGGQATSEAAETAGAGAAAGSAPRVLDDLAAGLNEISRMGEETLGIGRGAVDEGAQAADEGGGLFDDLLGGADETASAADEGASLGDEGTQAADDFTGASDDAVESAVRGAEEGADEGGGFVSRVLGRGSDDAASAADDTAGAVDDAADEGGSMLGNLIPDSRFGKILGGGGLLVGGGAVYDQLNPDDAPDEFTTADGMTFQSVRELDPTEEFPNGGIIYNVQENYQTAGYWVLLGVRGRNLILLDESREPRTAKISVEDFRQQRMGGSSGGQGGSA